MDPRRSAQSPDRQGHIARTARAPGEVCRCALISAAAPVAPFGSGVRWQRCSRSWGCRWWPASRPRSRARDRWWCRRPGTSCRRTAEQGRPPLHGRQLALDGRDAGRAAQRFGEFFKVVPGPRRRAPTPTCTSAWSRPTTAPAHGRAGLHPSPAAASRGVCSPWQEGDGRCQRPPKDRATDGPRTTYSPSSGAAAPDNLPPSQDLARDLHLHGVGRRARLRLRAPARVGLRRAHNNIAENAGFLRDDALLAVVFVTNEDDGSAPPDTDLFDRNKAASTATRTATAARRASR